MVGVMSDPDDVDVERVLAEVRERVRRRAGGTVAGERQSSIAERQAVADLATLQSHVQLQAVHFPTDRKWLGGVVGRAKRALRRLLLPILQRQSEYNEA